jgi:hypothetical protein
VNELYMKRRAEAIRLGAIRHSTLQRAAEAWRQGDGAAAKRFSREAQDLNVKMAKEAAEAARQLAMERARLVETAVRARDANWSDDPGDRVARGKLCGDGLGVCLGIARPEVCGREAKISSTEERSEVLMDLHGLHANEAVELMENFVLALEKEKFLGLAYFIVGREKHTGTQDPGRGASRDRLAAGVRDWLFKWGYPWSERDGIICVDVLTHS